MKKALAIFKRDIKRLLCNPVALVITIGVCIIPSLYAWYNIVANWDPYGNTQNIKIAVANNDKGTTNDLVGELNAGDEVIDKLKDNDQLGWTIVDSEKEAKEGVEAGKYYAALVIPSDFSEGMLSMLSGDFHQPKLTYYVNEKKSAVAVKVTDTGANCLHREPDGGGDCAEGGRRLGGGRADRPGQPCPDHSKRKRLGAEGARCARWHDRHD